MTRIPARPGTPLLLFASFSAGAILAAAFAFILTSDNAPAGVVLGESARPIPTRTATASEASLQASTSLDNETRRDPPYTYAALPAGYRIESVGSGLTNPTSLDGSPDGRIFVAEQYTGAVRVVYGGVLLEEPFYVLPDLRIEAGRGFVSELGLVGLLVEPAQPGLVSVLLYYSAQAPDGAHSTKLVRITERLGREVSVETIMELPYDANCCHIGGGLTLLRDGTILVGVGDHEQPDAARSFGSPIGKVLRITRDGSAPSDNPFARNVLADDRIYALGLRNPFGVADGYVLDNGTIGFDAVYRLRAGADYGWPSSARPAITPVEQPLLLFMESLGMAAATVYRGKLKAFENDLLYCQFHRGGALHWFPDTTDGPYDFDRVLAGGCSSGIRVLPDGNIYYLDYFDGVVYRITDGR